MPPLHTQLRKKLEDAVKQARRTAEAAARVALERLTVGGAEPGAHLTVDERLLRNRLRAHGRQLGDLRDPQTGGQSINRLVHECAYEHWHQMLFARFLAENHLLIHEKLGMPVTLAECDELAVEEGAPDGWTLAARYAARMLPQIFRPDDPVLQVGFAPEHKRALENLVTELPVEVFTAEDSLGWVYQFWQADRKDEVNASGDKITGETLPAVTQLFTEHYMVLFLLHNTIGAWWAGRTLTAEVAETAESEEDCRKAVALPGYEFTYLRFVREEIAEEESTAESAENTEKKDNSLKPDSGSAPSACSAVENTDGITTAEDAENTEKNKEKPFLDSASAPSAISAVKKYRWRPAAGTFPGWPKTLKDFKLLDPCCGSGHFLVAAFVLLALLRMQDEKLSAKDACDAVLRENLHGLELDPRCTQIAAFALALTAWKFPNLPAPTFESTAEIAEKKAGIQSPSALSACSAVESVSALGFRPLPPLNIACSGLGVNARKEDWLALADGDTRLSSGMEQLYDLFQKAPELGSLINPRLLAQGDLVTASFAEIQPLLTKALQSEKAKKNDDLNEIGVAAQGMAQAAWLLGSSFNVVVTNVPYLARGKHGEDLKDFCERFSGDAKTDLATVFIGRCLNFCAPSGVSALVTPQNWLFLGSYKNLRQRLLKETHWEFVVRLGEHGFDSSQAAGAFTALVALSCCLPDGTQNFAGLDVADKDSPAEKDKSLCAQPVLVVSQKIQLENPDSRISFERNTGATLLSNYAQTFEGLTTGDLERFVQLFWEQLKKQCGWEFFIGSASVQSDFGAREQIILWENGCGALANSPSSFIKGEKAWGELGLRISQTRNLVPTIYTGELFDKNAATLVPKSQSFLPAIYCFTKSDTFTTEVRKIDQSLKVTIGTLVKIPFDLPHWQRVAAEKYPNGLPEPHSNDPTQWLFDGHPVESTAPLQVGLARLLGYRWPRQTGQTVSGAPPVADDGLEKLADEDGIVCIPSVRGEPPAAERLRALLAAAYGNAWIPGKLDELLSTVGYAGSNLEDWLRNGFFEQHYKLFHNRPFIWQIWDGRKDGFSALVNYHKLDHKLLEKLTYTYLGDWIKKQREAVTNEESGADDRLLKAQQLQDKLKLILEGEAPYDIFIRWKPLDQQPIGWNPDLNDGVRLNIRPFMVADILRKRPNIKWGIDRGKNSPGSPWGEERNNDKHLTLEEKGNTK